MKPLLTLTGADVDALSGEMLQWYLDAANAHYIALVRVWAAQLARRADAAGHHELAVQARAVRDSLPPIPRRPLAESALTLPPLPAGHTLAPVR